MPLDGSGNFIPLAGAGNAAPLTKIKSKDQHNDLWADAALAISAKIDADGRKPFTAPVRGVAGTLPDHLTTKAQLDAVVAGVGAQSRPETYGALGDGANDDGPAILACAAASGGTVVGRPGAIYRTAGQFLLPSVFTFDLNGGMWRPAYQGPSHAIQRLQVHGTENAVSSNIAGSQSVTLAAPPVDVSVGDWVFFSTTSFNGRWPACPRKVTSITGNTVAFHCLIPWQFPAGTTMRRRIATGDLTIRNGRIDCSQILDPAGGECLGLLDADGYEDYIFEGIEIENYNLNPVATDWIIRVTRGNRVSCRDIRVENGAGERGILTATQCGDVLDINTFFDGDGFGIAAVDCETATTINLTARGRWIFGGSSRSIRGWRPIGCGVARLIGGTITAYDSAIKNEDNLSCQVSFITTQFCNTGFNNSPANSHVGLGRVTASNCNFQDCVTHGIVDVDTLSTDHRYRDIVIDRPGDHGVNIAGLDKHLSGITVRDWLPGKHPIVWSEIGGVKPRGSMRDIEAKATITASRLAIQVPADAVDMLIDDASIRCNVPGATGGGFENRPPRVYALPPGVVRLARAAVVFNTTADQPVTLSLPTGFSRYRFFAGFVYNNAAVDVSAAVGGLYSGAGKTGTQIIPATQVYTSLITNNTNQNLGFTTPGVQEMTDLTLFWSLTTPAAAASSGTIEIYGVLA